MKQKGSPAFARRSSMVFVAIQSVEYVFALPILYETFGGLPCGWSRNSLNWPELYMYVSSANPAGSAGRQPGLAVPARCHLPTYPVL